MSVITMVEAIKQIHPKDVAFVKVGQFYRTYGKDSYILANLMGYQLRTASKNCSTCGFPLGALPKVEALFENKKINYIVVDQRNNYDVDEHEDYKNLNNYDEEFHKAQKNISLKRRIENINTYLTQNINSQKTLESLRKIEEILENEG